MNEMFTLLAIAGTLFVFWLIGAAGDDPLSKYNTRASERKFQEAHHTGVMEYQLADGTRVDDLTRTHAIEYDFAKKWAEAVGQSLHYARMTGKRAGIVLILQKDADTAKLDNILALKLPITVWTVKNLSTAPELVESTR